jgi:malonyl CoA-acyl carrier protein transacylase
MNNCCIFAGQGAQIPGMGKDFAEADVEVMGFFDKANAVLGFDLKKIDPLYIAAAVVGVAVITLIIIAFLK